MSIFLDRSSRVVVQGISGKMAQFHTKEMIDYGTNVVAGVVPGKAGERVHGVPIFDTMKQAHEATGCDTSLAFVPPPFAAAQRLPSPPLPPRSDSPPGLCHLPHMHEMLQRLFSVCFCVRIFVF